MEKASVKNMLVKSLKIKVQNDSLKYKVIFIVIASDPPAGGERSNFFVCHPRASASETRGPGFSGMDILFCHHLSKTDLPTVLTWIPARPNDARQNDFVGLAVGQACAGMTNKLISS